jgi:hypothetical protein
MAEYMKEIDEVLKIIFLKIFIQLSEKIQFIGLQTQFNIK